jgi:hypothetical protein
MPHAPPPIYAPIHYHIYPTWSRLHTNKTDLKYINKTLYKIKSYWHNSTLQENCKLTWQSYKRLRGFRVFSDKFLQPNANNTLFLCLLSSSICSPNMRSNYRSIKPKKLKRSPCFVTFSPPCIIQFFRVSHCDNTQCHLMMNGIHSSSDSAMNYSRKRNRLYLLSTSTVSFKTVNDATHSSDFENVL